MRFTLLVLAVFFFLVPLMIGCTGTSGPAPTQASAPKAAVQEPFKPFSHNVPGLVSEDYKYMFESMGGITLWDSPSRTGKVGSISQPGATVEVLAKKDGHWQVSYNGVTGWASEKILTNSGR